MNDEIPLIWTSKGNLPIADLECKRSWSVNKDEIVFVEEYFLGEECVKRGAHIHKLEGTPLSTAIANLGG